MLAAHDAMADFDSRSWLGRIAQPTLIICGAQDRAVPGHHARELARGIKGAELREFAGAGHGLIYTHTPPFVDLLETWLREEQHGEESDTLRGDGQPRAHHLAE